VLMHDEPARCAGCAWHIPEAGGEQGSRSRGLQNLRGPGGLLACRRLAILLSHSTALQSHG
jgi:hypothetical protein